MRSSITHQLHASPLTAVYMTHAIRVYTQINMVISAKWVKRKSKNITEWYADVYAPACARLYKEPLPWALRQR